MTSEAEKLSSHLALLRAEYVKLQQKCTRLERDLAVVSAQVGSVTTSVIRYILYILCHRRVTRRMTRSCVASCPLWPASTGSLCTLT